MDWQQYRNSGLVTYPPGGARKKGAWRQQWEADMPYIMARLFSGSSDQSPGQLDRIACQELVPQLLQIPGLLRYSTVQLTDGRVGSFSVYENREAAERGLPANG